VLGVGAIFYALTYVKLLRNVSCSQPIFVQKSGLPCPCGYQRNGLCRW